MRRDCAQLRRGMARIAPSCNVQKAEEGTLFSVAQSNCRSPCAEITNLDSIFRGQLSPALNQSAWWPRRSTNPATVMHSKDSLRFGTRASVVFACTPLDSPGLARTF
jgi:hypothetical protein